VRNFYVTMPTLRPAADEFAPYYAPYVAHVADGDILTILREQADAFRGLFARVPDEFRLYAYAEGKWTLSEVVQHINDTERVFAYRALRIARGDTLALPGFDQDAWVPESAANDRSLASLIEEFTAIRSASITLFAGLPASAWDRRGTASNNPVSVRGQAFILAGHALHHEGIIRERYLP
jgi:hypothetical protein